MLMENEWNKRANSDILVA